MRAREIIRSSRRVLDALATSYDTSPSASVVAKAGDILRRNPRFSTHRLRSAYVMPITSEDGQRVYATTIVFDRRGEPDIELTHCTCEAGRAETLCHHLLAALVSADHLGYRMETPKR